MGKTAKPKVDYVVKEYVGVCDLQRHLNQWKHDYELSIEAMNVIRTSEAGDYLLIVVVKRVRKGTD